MRLIYGAKTHPAKPYRCIMYITRQKKFGQVVIVRSNLGQATLENNEGGRQSEKMHKAPPKTRCNSRSSKSNVSWKRGKKWAETTVHGRTRGAKRMQQEKHDMRLLVFVQQLCLAKDLAMVNARRNSHENYYLRQVVVPLRECTFFSLVLA